MHIRNINSYDSSKLLESLSKWTTFILFLDFSWLEAMRYLVKDKSQQAVVINIQYKQIPGGPLDPGYRHCSVEYRVGCRWRVLQCRVFVPLYLFSTSPPPLELEISKLPPHHLALLLLLSWSQTVAGNIIKIFARQVTMKCHHKVKKHGNMTRILE